MAGFFGHWAMAAWGILGAAAMGYAQEPNTTDVAKTLDPGLKTVAEGSQASFGDLYGRLKNENEFGMGNLFFSPYSVSSALAMTARGAKGSTAEAMAKILHLTGGEATDLGFKGLNAALMGEGREKGYELRVANALWGQKGEAFLPAFTNVLRTDFNAGLEQLDFGNAEPARQTINAWVAKQTQDKIKDLLPAGSVTPDTRLVLTNAIYFKGKWETPFSRDSTAQELFRTRHSDVVKTPLMHENGRVGYAEDENCQALEMGYEGGKLAMLVLLPKENNVTPPGVREGSMDPLKAGMTRLENALDGAYVKEVRAKLAQKQVNVTLPKWKMTQGRDLTQTLVAMGMQEAFSRDADFSGMNGRKDFLISAVVHKAFIAVDEEGTEAAGATGVMVRGMAMQVEEQPEIFKADRAFVYLILDKESGVVLFAGRVSDPTAEN